MMNHFDLSEDELNSIKSVVHTHRAAETAIFSLSVQKQELQALRNAASRILHELEIPETSTPQINGARAVSTTFQAIPAHQEILRKRVERIAASQSTQQTATLDAGGPETVRLLAETAQELAKEFTVTLTVDPDMKSGKPCVRGLRITVFDVLELIACGNAPADIIAQEPLLDEEDIQDCIQFGLKLTEAASRCARHETAD